MNQFDEYILKQIIRPNFNKCVTLNKKNLKIIKNNSFIKNLGFNYKYFIIIKFRISYFLKRRGISNTLRFIFLGKNRSNLFENVIKSEEE